MSHLPTISLTALENPARRADEIRTLRSACREPGFFFIRDHGIDESLVNRALLAARRFFELPSTTKAQFGQDNHKITPRTARGYVAAYGEILHVPSGPDNKEAIDIGLERAVTARLFTGPNHMPDSNLAPDFAASQLELQKDVMERVTPTLLRGLAGALELSETYFDPYFSDPILIQRTAYYPAHAGNAGRHTDNGMLTVLIREPADRGALRVYSRDSWIDVPVSQDTILINLGDIFQQWTDGRYVSTPHEVLNGNAQSRVSIPFFIYPNIEAVFHSVYEHRTISCRQVMLANFESIWESHQGAGRSHQLG